jgi:uncharacterized protein YjcR
LEFFEKSLSEGIAGFALLTAVFAAWQSVKANKIAKSSFERSEIEKATLRKVELIIAEEKKVAVASKLIMTLVQKQELIKQHPFLADTYPNESSRIQQCLAVLSEQRKSQGLAYELLDHDDIGKDIKLSKQSLADCVRLTIRMESDLENEKVSLLAMQKLVSSA